MLFDKYVDTKYLILKNALTEIPKTKIQIFHGFKFLLKLRNNWDISSINDLIYSLFAVPLVN
jgi:hypothetical protein